MWFLASVMLSSCDFTFNAFIPSLCLLTSFWILEVQDKPVPDEDISAHIRSTFPQNPYGTETLPFLCHISFTTCIARELLTVWSHHISHKVCVLVHCSSHIECPHQSHRCSNTNPVSSVVLPSASLTCKHEILCHVNFSVLCHFLTPFLSTGHHCILPYYYGFLKLVSFQHCSHIICSPRGIQMLFAKIQMQPFHFPT